MQDACALVAGERRPVCPCNLDGPAHLLGRGLRHRTDECAGVGIVHVQRAVTVDALAGDAHRLLHEIPGVDDHHSTLESCVWDARVSRAPMKFLPRTPSSASTIMPAASLSLTP